MAKLRVVAERKFSLKGIESVTIRLWTPGRYARGNRDYYCNYEIIGLGPDFLSHSIGADSFQALISAITSMDTILKTSEAYKSGDLTWDAEMSSGDLGLIGYTL